MNNSIYAADAIDGLQKRIDQLRPDTQGLWGKMDVAQMLAHCTHAISTTVSEDMGKLSFFGFLFGKLAKKSITSEKPFKQNLPTAKDFIIVDQRNFIHEKQKLKSILQILAERGPKGVAGKIHPFFGKMTTEEWSTLIYKHLDHHLRQFGV